MNIEIILILIWVIVQAIVGTWLFKAKPPKNILGKYSKLILFQSMVPFLSKWRSGINSDDLVYIEKYRKRFFAQYFATFLLPIILFYFYLYYEYVWATE